MSIRSLPPFRLDPAGVLTMAGWTQLAVLAAALLIGQQGMIAGMPASFLSLLFMLLERGTLAWTVLSVLSHLYLMLRLGRRKYYSHVIRSVPFDQSGNLDRTNCYMCNIGSIPGYFVGHLLTHDLHWRDKSWCW